MIDFTSKPASKMALAKRSLVCGVGINDCPHVVNLSVNGKTSIYQPYSSWLNMIKRCYSDNYLERRPTYEKAIVCDDWLYFSNYLKWHLLNHVEGWCLDKDILGEGLVYSPETCVFIPKAINNFVEDSMAIRGNNPIGVCFTNSGKYHAYCKDPFLKKRVNIGYFSAKTEAAKARLDYKLGLLDKYKQNLDLIDKRLYFGIFRIICNQR